MPPSPLPSITIPSLDGSDVSVPTREILYFVSTSIDYFFAPSSLVTTSGNVIATSLSLVDTINAMGVAEPAILVNALPLRDGRLAAWPQGYNLAQAVVAKQDEIGDFSSVLLGSYARGIDINDVDLAASAAAAIVFVAQLLGGGSPVIPSDAAPLANAPFDAPQAGVSSLVSRYDHQHPHASGGLYFGGLTDGIGQFAVIGAQKTLGTIPLGFTTSYADRALMLVVVNFSFVNQAVEQFQEVLVRLIVDGGEQASVRLQNRDTTAAASIAYHSATLPACVLSFVPGVARAVSVTMEQTAGTSGTTIQYDNPGTIVVQEI